MKVRVTEAHIKNGIAKDSHHCMIADAVKECCPTAQYITVDLQTIRFTDPAKRQRVKYLTPAAAQSALLKFDRGDKTIRPFTFALTAPLIRKCDSRTSSQKRPNKPKRTKAEAKAHAKKYAYLAANRAKLSRDREFGLRKFVD